MLRLARSPTAETLVAFATVFVLQRAVGLVGVDLPLALAAPLFAQPWTLVTSVYAHASLGHLLANAVALALLGFPIERATTRPRFHAYVIVTGGIAGVAQVAASDFLGAPVAVMGASGAVLALLGYAAAGNRITDTLLARVDLGTRAAVAAILALALAVTVLTGGPGVALVAHFTGFVLGLVAGRFGLL